MTASVFMALSGTAQQVTNNGFEDWTSQGTYEDPDGWGTFNFIADFGLPSTTTKDADANSGSFAAKLTTTEVTFFGTTDTVTGFLTLGSFDVAGEPFTAMPTSMEFYYKYDSPGADSGGAVVTLTKWDAVNNTQAIIGTGEMIISQALAYTQGSVNINYMSTETPDSIQIMFISSTAAMPVPGSALYVDDVSFTTQASAVAVLEADRTRIFPNPAKDYLYIKTEGLQASSIEITDLSGRVIDVISIEASSKADIAHLPAGNYLYQLKDGNIPVSRGKFTVMN